MKKLLALSLSVIMAMSLAVPAFADGPDGPPSPEDLGYYVDGDLAPGYTPGDVIPISAILDDGSIGIIGGQDGPTAIITSGFDLESFKWDGYDLEGLDPDTTDWSSMETHFQQLAQAQRDELKKAMGGVPGQIGVMVNGEYVQFPDAAPEITGGRTMVPVRALVETLGGEVSYEDGTVTFTIDESAYEFVVGSATVTVRACDTGIDTPLDTIEMDCAPYIKDGRTYVPIRFISEALGYEVGWDSAFQTAILLDRAALKEKFDKDFTIMNKVQANRVSGWEQGKTLSSGVKGNVTVTAFDTLSGNKTYKADFDSQVLMDNEAASGSFSIKLSDNIAALLTGQYGYMDEGVLERMDLMVKALEKAEFIMNRDGQMWVKSPALDELAGEKNIWCGMDLDLDEAQTVFVNSDTATVGTVLAGLASTDSVMMWSQVGPVTAVMELYRDENFTTSGGVSTLTLGLDDLAGVYQAIGGSAASLEEAKELFKEYEITIKVDSRGGATVTCDMETVSQLGMRGMRITMKATQSGGRAELTMDVHIANTGEMKLTMNTTQRGVSDKPMSEPPAGANVVDAPALLDGYGESID